MTAVSAKSDHPLFEVRKSSIQGRGAFALRKIRKGQRIIEYTGERISDEEADARYDESKMKRHHTFLFTVTPSIVVDGAVGGSDAIYINHSCEPNCEAVIENRRIYIYALRTIQPGEELGYDYQFEHTGDPDEEKFYVCHCGSEKCRGSIMLPAKPKRRRKPVAKTKTKTKAKTKKRVTKAKKGTKSASKRGTRGGGTRAKRSSSDTGSRSGRGGRKTRR